MHLVSDPPLLQVRPLTTAYYVCAAYYSHPLVLVDKYGASFYLELTPTATSTWHHLHMNHGAAGPSIGAVKYKSLCASVTRQIKSPRVPLPGGPESAEPVSPIPAMKLKRV